MRIIATGREELLTSAEVADAILTYAGALARAGTADTVTIPIVRDDGEPDEARLLLGPASQITIMPGRSDDIDLPTSAETTEHLEQKTRRLEPAPIADHNAPDVGSAANHFVSLDDD